VSDATGETLSTVAKAACVQYASFKPIEHIHSLVRSPRQLTRVVKEIEHNPGVVLFTMINEALKTELEQACAELSVPCISVLDPVVKILSAYLNAKSTPHVGGQHVLDTAYFDRIEALNFSMLHDDGQLPEDLEQAELVLVGISRTSKTPTSIYLANRGIKTANIPIVKDLPLPPNLATLKSPLVVGLIATPERILQIRRNRLLSLKQKEETTYVDKRAIAAELTFAKKLCARHNWPIIDVTRRSIEETAAAVMQLLADRARED
jgi:regulator of PEP synthase PpsR (kinase-PPPase family)